MKKSFSLCLAFITVLSIFTFALKTTSINVKAKEEISRIFERFYKVDKSRSYDVKGVGLGLYIVKTIICSHGEDISVSSAGGNTEFTFTLPLEN